MALALLEPVTVAVHFQDVDVVREAIEQRTGESFRAEYFMMPPIEIVWWVVLVGIRH